MCCKFSLIFTLPKVWSLQYMLFFLSCSSLWHEGYSISFFDVAFSRFIRSRSGLKCLKGSKRVVVWSYRCFPLFFQIVCSILYIPLYKIEVGKVKYITNSRNAGMHRIILEYCYETDINFVKPCVFSICNRNSYHSFLLTKTGLI